MRILLRLAQLVSLLLAGSAQAQSSACEQFKATLAARIDASSRGFTLEIAAADAPLPPGAKVVGTCEGGARKILLRRGVAAAQAQASAPTPVPVPVRAPAPAAPMTQPPPPAPAAEIAQPAPAASQAAAPVEPQPEPQAGPTLRDRAVALLSSWWRWLVALAALPIAIALWAWIAHRRAYDESGLPRGPRLN